MLEREREAQIPNEKGSSCGNGQRDSMPCSRRGLNKGKWTLFVLSAEPKRHVPCFYTLEHTLVSTISGDFCRWTRTKKPTDAGVIGVLNGPPWHC